MIIQELETLIKHHDRLYWIEGNPEISDPEYDQLIEELKSIDSNNSLVNRIHTPTVTADGKIVHKYPMLSLDKVYSVGEILKWCGKVARNSEELFEIQLKLDGATGEFNRGVLSTRGDGHIGENITNKLPIIKFAKYDYSDYIVGEIVMTHEDFNIVRNTSKNGTYKTPRNTCAGILNRDDVNTEFGKILTFVPFDYDSIKIKYKHMIGFDWDALIQKAMMAQYPADGLVIKLNDKEYSESLGMTSHHPRGQMALKFKNPSGTTVLTGIFPSIGKNVITPVGLIEPVEIGGVTVSRVNLHNYKYILDKDIHIGDTLIIERCGDIIPDVQEVIPGNNRTEIKILSCPVCGSNAIYEEPILKCSNTKCTGKLLQCLCDSVTRIGIEGLGEPTIEKLINKGCNSLIDILLLKKEDIITLDGFAEQSSQNLYDQIHKVIDNGVYEWQVLASLNIEGIGERMSKILLNQTNLSKLRRMSTDDLITFEGIGPERSGDIFLSLNILGNYIDTLLKILKIKRTTKVESNKTICFTGKMPEKRSFYHNLAKRRGYEPVKDVTTSLSLLVNSEEDRISEKVKKAFNYNVRIITLDEFMEGAN